MWCRAASFNGNTADPVFSDLTYSQHVKTSTNANAPLELVADRSEIAELVSIVGSASGNRITFTINYKDGLGIAKTSEGSVSLTGVSVPVKFTELTDTPSVYDNGKFLQSTASGLSWVSTIESSTKQDKQANYLYAEGVIEDAIGDYVGVVVIHIIEMSELPEGSQASDYNIPFHRNRIIW